MTDPQIRLALFDIDGTLTTENLWRGITVSPNIGQDQQRRLMRRSLPYWMLVKLRLYSELRFRHRWIKGLAQLFRGWPQDEVDRLFDWVVNSYLVPFYRDDVIAELHQHQAGNVHVILVSNIFEGLAEHLARRLGAEKGLGTRLEFHDGIATGAIVGRPCAGPQKVEAVSAYLRSQQVDVEPGEAAASYADSISDVPLLEAARFPTATYPDPQLAAVAVKRGWRILRAPITQ